MKIMKTKKYCIMTLLFLGSFGHTTVAQDCDIPLSIYLEDQLIDAPQGAIDVIENNLKQIILNNGGIMELSNSQFGITVSVVQLERKNLAGPPAKVINKVGVTLYIIDVIGKKRFAEYYFEETGVGNTDTQSLIRIFKGFKFTNPKLNEFVQTGKDKIVDYYNQQYKNIQKEARRLASLRSYEEALYLLCSIPSCCYGATEVDKLILEIYSQNLDIENEYLFNLANSVWAAGQDSDAAKEAAYYLSQIDPEAKCYNKALALSKEIKSQRRKDLDFELREKYKNDIELQKRRIEAAKAIGVAYGNHQKPTTVNLLWLRR